VVNLGAYEFTLSYDPQIIQYVSAENGSFLGSSGREIYCLGAEPHPTSVHLTCLTLGGEPDGPNGSGVLATVTFAAAQLGDSALTLDEATLTDPMGQVIPSGRESGSVRVVDRPAPTETATSTPVPIATAVRVSPASQDVTVGDTFSVDLQVESVSDLGAYQFGLQFDPAVIGYVSVSDGPFLSSTGGSVLCQTPVVNAGVLSFGCAIVDVGISGPSGSGTMTQITFQANAVGTSPLDLTSVSLTDISGEPISSAAIGGSVSVSEPTGFAPAKSTAVRIGAFAFAAAVAGRLGLMLRSSAGAATGEKDDRSRRKRSAGAWYMAVMRWLRRMSVRRR